MKVVDSFAYSLIETRKGESDIEVSYQLNINAQQREDLLSRYMCMKDQNGKPFSDKYLRDMVLNFL